MMLFQIPQRYRFSSKSQPFLPTTFLPTCCFRYHKGTDFQANHNNILQLCILQELFQIPQRYRFSSKSQRYSSSFFLELRCFRYHKGTDFQANHNNKYLIIPICTLFQIPQRYRFSSKSQRRCPACISLSGCFRYHKGTDFQANHNRTLTQVFNQRLFQIPQRYRFSSKSQQSRTQSVFRLRCFRYHKGTDFQANHNTTEHYCIDGVVVLDTTKVQIFKQITTML